MIGKLLNIFTHYLLMHQQIALLNFHNHFAWKLWLDICSIKFLWNLQKALPLFSSLPLMHRTCHHSLDLNVQSMLRLTTTLELCFWHNYSVGRQSLISIYLEISAFVKAIFFISMILLILLKSQILFRVILNNSYFYSRNHSYQEKCALSQ